MSNVSRLRPDVGVPLTNLTLQLHSSRVAVPRYDRSALTRSIVHVGVGGFHRAHQEMYFDDLAVQRISDDWGVTGVGLHSRDMKAALSAQDCLYTVVQRGAGVERARVVGSLCQYLYARGEGMRVHAALTDPATRIVTLTITGGGYHLDPQTGEFDVDAEPVRADRAAVGEYDTVWAYLVDALNHRRRSGIPPFTVMSCDNLPDNGAAARKALVSFAELRSPQLAAWINDNVAFPSSMVDRITPKTAPRDRKSIERMFGVADRWPVVTEPFTQWVVEDTFSHGRPPLEEVGVEMVDDVTPHKLAKTRLLNGIHCAIGYLGLLAGYQRTDQAMRNPLIHRYVEELMQDEISPLLSAVPGWDMAEYRSTVLERLMNPHISDQLSRLAARGSVKMPAYLLPSLHEARAQHRQHNLLTLALAAWMRYLRGYDLGRRPITVDDPRAHELTTKAKLGQYNPVPLLKAADVFGDDLQSDDDFIYRLSDKLKDIDRSGVEGAIRRTLAVPLADAVGT